LNLDKLLSIVIVNWNAGIQLTEVINSIADYHNNLVSSVIIVDNASTDDSVSQVESIKDLPFKLHIIRNDKNMGFGAACNQGAKLANSEYILFLNPDMKLYANSLTVPVAFMQDPKNYDVGIVGIQLIDETGDISRSCARFPTLGMFFVQATGLNRLQSMRKFNLHMSDWSHEKTAVVDHVIGAFYLMKRTLFESLDGFDERFFVYLEDLDLSLRARQAGLQSVYLADAKAFHAGGGTSRQVKVHRLFYSLRSRLLYGFKHFNFFQAWLLVLITLGVEPFSRTLYSLFRANFNDVYNTWKAYYMLFKDMKFILKKRDK
jgi:GT2 family glycosyltransferase